MPHRHFLGRIFAAAVRSATGLRFQDTQCGFKMFRGDTARELFALSRLEGFSFDVEILYLCQRLGLKVEEVPVRWMHVAGSKVTLAITPWKMLAELLRIKGLHRDLDSRRSPEKRLTG